jgi:hypothetical protein
LGPSSVAAQPGRPVSCELLALTTRRRLQPGAAATSTFETEQGGVGDAAPPGTDDDDARARGTVCLAPGGTKTSVARALDS